MDKNIQKYYNMRQHFWNQLENDRKTIAMYNIQRKNEVCMHWSIDIYLGHFMFNNVYFAYMSK